MAGITTTTDPGDVASRLQTYFSKKLLKHIEETLVLDQFAATEDLPANKGGKVIRFFKRRHAKRDDIRTLSGPVVDSSDPGVVGEGVPISVFTQVEMGYIDVTLRQRGEATKISDVLEIIDMYKPLKQNIEAMGEDAALDFDTITRNAIVTGLNDSNNGFERFAGQPIPIATGGSQSADRFTALSAATAANSIITRARALACVTQLKANRVPTMMGGYVCVVGPQVIHDIRQDDDWVAAATNVNNRALYKREVISLDGVTYVETTNPWTEDDTYKTFDETDATNPDDLIYTTMFLGRGAYGCPKIGGTSSPLRPQVIVNDKPDKSDPLNQFVTAGWKAFWNAALLKTNLSFTKNGVSVTDVPYACLLRSKSTFNSTV